MIIDRDAHDERALLTVIDTLPPVTLDALNGLAELQTRVDRKYLVPAGSAESALRTVADRLAVLDIDGVRSFRYDSLYFDTPDLASYRAAATRRRRRFKVRVRRYVDAGNCTLEIKTRGGRGETVKTRFEHQPESIDALDQDAQRCIDLVLGSDPVAHRLQPVLWTTYLRSTMVDVRDRSRVTLDRRLAASLVGPAAQWRSLTDELVVETKSGAGATPLDRALWAAHVRPISISKFAIGMAAHHPDLPANRWSRVLRHHVDQSPRGRAAQPLPASAAGSLG